MKKKNLRQLKKNLPETPGIIGEETLFKSAVMLLLFVQNGEYHFIFQKRSSNVSQPGEISFPGGKIEENDKNPVETAVRETVEELGISKEKISVVGRLNSHVSPYGAKIDAVVGIADIANLGALDINEDEVEYVFSAPVSWFEKNSPEEYHLRLKAESSYIDDNGKEIVLFPVKELGLPKKYASSWGNIKRKIYLYKYEKEIIWGITARFIVDFLNRLKPSGI